MTKRITRSTTVSINGRPVKPNGDVITQSELAAVRELDSVMQRIGANLARRLALGATLETGPLIISDYEPGEMGHETDAVPLRFSPECGNTPISFRNGEIEVDSRKGALRILGYCQVPRKTA